MNINEMLKTLTLDEKLKLLTGKNGWQTEDLDGKLPSMFLSDGPHGLRKCETQADGSTYRVPSTAYPTLSSIGNSWSSEAARVMADAIADECVEHDADVLLAPGVNMKRTPLCGRNFEYFSEDPFLAGTLAYAYIKAVEDRHVGTSLKHFACNNREVYRHLQNNEVDERTLFEIYLKAFEIALKAKPTTVMCSYNLLNGVYASENRYLLNSILRERFGFEGVIVSDWHAVKNRAKSLKATIDLDMPFEKESFIVLKKAYEDGFITDVEIDECVERMLKMIDENEKRKAKREVRYTKEERHQKAVDIATECVVLLKNEDGILPLAKDATVDVYRMENDNFAGGGGSALVVMGEPFKFLGSALREAGVAATTYHSSTERGEGDVSIVCVGNGLKVEGEGFDRTNIKLTKRQVNLIKQTARINPNTVVVLYTGSAVDVSEWAGDVKAIVQAGFSGEGVNEALAKILKGEVSPSGKLSETYPICLEDTPSGDDIGDSFVERYEEGLFMGYRWFDKGEKPVAYPFGYGLSYADFEYSDLSIEKKSETDYVVSYNITNKSKFDAKEISQIYISDVVSAVTRPVKELKAFSKDLIKAGETKRVTLTLDRAAFAYYNPNINDWYVENGKYKILVGSSSRDIRLAGEVKVSLPEYTQYSRHNYYDERGTKVQH